MIWMHKGTRQNGLWGFKRARQAWQVIINRAAVNSRKNPDKAKTRQVLRGVLTASRQCYSSRNSTEATRAPQNLNLPWAQSLLRSQKIIICQEKPRICDENSKVSVPLSAISQQVILDRLLGHFSKVCEHETMSVKKKMSEWNPWRDACE